MKVLIIDDNIDVQEIFNGREIEGVEFVAVTHESQALALLIAEHFDGVLIDLSMPNIDGLELAHQIRVNEMLTPKQVCNRLAYHTAFNIENDMDTQRVMHREGVEKVFRKPIDPYELAESVKEWLSNPPSISGSSYD